MKSEEFLKIFDVRSIEFKNNQILLNNISRRFLLTTKLFTGGKIRVAVKSFITFLALDSEGINVLPISAGPCYVKLFTAVINTADL